MIRAVVFDWDGTLADTIQAHFTSYREALKGVADMRPEDLYIREGKRAVDIISDLARGVGRDEIRRIVKRKEEIYGRLSGDIKIIPEGRELIIRLKGSGLRVGLVTGTRRANLNRVMSRYEIGMFDFIVAADETMNPKPNPEPYLKCARGLGVSPGEAVAVENAPLGIRSAKRAGMACIAIASTLPESYLKGADFIVKGLREAGGVIYSQLRA